MGTFASIRNNKHPMTMDEEAKIKKNIQRTRTRLGFSQTEMARRLELSLKGFRNLESGSTSIFTKSFRTFAEETGIPLTELVTGFTIEEQESFGKAKESFEQRLRIIEKGYRQELDEANERNQKLMKENKNLKKTLKDKEDIIATDKKLIAQYESQIENLATKS